MGLRLQLLLVGIALLAVSSTCVRIGFSDEHQTSTKLQTSAAGAVGARQEPANAIRELDSDDQDDAKGMDSEGMTDVSFLLLGARVRGDTPEGDDAFCHKNRYRKRTLKVVKEMPFVGLFPELQRTRRFEGSGITYAKGSYWVVFDSLRSLGQIDLRFSFRGPENHLVGPVGDESQFEGISYDDESDTFFVLRESFEHDEHGLVPLTEQLKLSEDGNTYTVLEKCIVRFQLQDVNKGFESLYVFTRDGKRQMLGMCESNHCKTILGPDPPGLQRGHGRLVWAEYQGADPTDEHDECRWNVKRVIKLPEDAFLLDYSAINFRGMFGEDVAVTSQEDAAVWIGKFDWTAMEFVHAEGADTSGPYGQIYHFPRTADCWKMYCNVEGVAWLDAERLVFASDKSKRIQDHRCMDRDQSVHIMALP
ncbi:hypothetical protein HYH03_014270 [Edaphochlamys debaryana]|uniref:Uncharacterized protein n=1 Tax=Edaphochlamys debaryana TaxID=47281 RepID=A0A835XN70_9CHLO|nr:hypothetical protein HYH03_014270 [Edaphochlamys debaryana]|eukprot:KAG2487158.1 hypothetical protein HYH03_014270 [Edaphochlamys debaryana]